MNHITTLASLQEYRAIMAHAKSDARFDGYDWIGLSRTVKEHYVARVRQGFEAAKLEVSQ